MSFNILRGMPVGQRALRSKIEQRSGEHIYFQDGKIYGGQNLLVRTPRPQISDGWTTRFFLYLPKQPSDHITTDAAQKAVFDRMDQSEMKIYYHGRTGGAWWFSVRNTNGHFDFPVADKNHTGTDDSNVTLPQDSYFSMALRIKGTEFCVAMLDEVELKTGDMKKIPKFDWQFRFKTGIQTLLSWHTTDETFDNKARWGTYLTMEDMWWPTGTLATVTVFVKSVPTDLYIRMQGNSNPDIYFSGANLKSGSIAHFSITLSDQETFVTTDFDKGRVGSVPSGPDGPHYIKPVVVKEFEIHRIEMVVPFFEE